MLPHDDNLAFGPDKIVIGKWATENDGSRRVHYPRSRMRKAGFASGSNDRGEVLLTQRRSGKRSGKWSIPGGNAVKGTRLSGFCHRGHLERDGRVFNAQCLYYENRHRARIWRGSSSLETREAILWNMVQTVCPTTAWHSPRQGPLKSGHPRIQKVVAFTIPSLLPLPSTYCGCESQGR